MAEEIITETNRETATDHAYGGAQIQVGGGNQLSPALKSHTPVGDLNILSPQTLDLKV